MEVLTLGAWALVTMAGAEAASLTGQLHVVWGEGPEGKSRVFLDDAGGRRVRVVLDAAAHGGLASLDRKHVTLEGEWLSDSTDRGAAAFRADSLERVTAPRMDADLLEKAKQKGRLGVIVTLDVGWRPEGNLASEGAAASQRETVANAQSAVLEALAGIDHTVIHLYQFVPQLALEVSPAALSALEWAPGVERVDEDTLSAPSLMDSVPLILAPGAWALGYEGNFMTLAVLDTGVRRTHDFLDATGEGVVSEACYSNHNPGVGQLSLCPGNVNSSTAAGSAEPCVGNAAGVGGCGHGTHVAGISAGHEFSGTGGVTFSGVGRNAQIIAVQIFTRFNNAADCNPSAAPCLLSRTSDQIAGLDRVYALRNNYRITSVNMSLGGGLTAANCDADTRKPSIDNLRSVGTSTVIAAGNNGSTSQISFPACISTSVAVGSTTKTDVVSSFSNAAAIMEMWAPGGGLPGTSIQSSIPTSDTSFGPNQGTSMAAPHVTGAWAILKEKRPYGTVPEVQNAFTSTGVNITDTRSGGTVTKPRIRVLNALNSIASSAEVTQLYNSSTTGTALTLWARVRNNGSAALPGSANVWFWTTWLGGSGYAGSANVGGLAAGAEQWYSFSWNLPVTAHGNTVNYWARIWDGAQGGFWVGPWNGPQEVDAGYPTRIASLWPVFDTAGGVPNRGDTVRLWAYVTSNRTTGAQPAAESWRYVAPIGPFPGTWEGQTPITGLAASASSWYLFNWTIPAAHATGMHAYSALVLYQSGGWRVWSNWGGPQPFNINP